MMACDDAWCVPQDHPALAVGDVHVWRAGLDQPDAVLGGLESHLSKDERERAGRFHFERDRRRFVAGRGVLRTIIGAYLDVRPEQVMFRYGQRGKPALAMPLAQGVPEEHEELRFNVSHSHDLALFAFARGQEVGVDLERMRPISDAGQIAQRFFSVSERSVLQSLPPELHQEAFFNCWTRKESYIKVIGDGLSQPLDRFDVSLAPGEAARLVRVNGDENEARHWSLLALAPGTGYTAALVVEGQCRYLCCFTWDVSVPGSHVS